MASLRFSHMVRAPGRVNLVGEHIDYCGLPVLPMAIQRSVRIAFHPRADREIRLTNRDARFPPSAFTVNAEIPPAPAGDWSNYPRAAAHALVQRFPNLRGVDAQVDSDLPVAAGLSSSSALVVATALALLHANRASVPLLELMDLLARGERYVGTAGGGMDQAIILGAQAGCASRIDSHPLRLTPRSPRTTRPRSRPRPRRAGPRCHGPWASLPTPRRPPSRAGWPSARGAGVGPGDGSSPGWCSSL